eukprot:6088036-Pyramimonas_sp.AAC.1
MTHSTRSSASQGRRRPQAHQRCTSWRRSRRRPPSGTPPLRRSWTRCPSCARIWRPSAAP